MEKIMNNGYSEAFHKAARQGGRYVRYNPGLMCQRAKAVPVRGLAGPATGMAHNDSLQYSLDVL